MQPPKKGYFGVGHDKWHRGFYDHLLQKDGSSCCNHSDCRPTQSRMVDNHYEVKVDGQWVTVRKDKILNVVAPDGGAHVCAPHQIEGDDGPDILRRASTGKLVLCSREYGLIKPGGLSLPGLEGASPELKWC